MSVVENNVQMPGVLDQGKKCIKQAASALCWKTLHIEVSFLWKQKETSIYSLR